MKSSVNCNVVFVNSRDLDGQAATDVARRNFLAAGKRGPDSGRITGSTGLFPVTVASLNSLLEGDIVFITSANGALSERLEVHNATPVSFQVDSFNNYTGGEWTRLADPGYPTVSDNPDIVRGASITVNLQNRVLKNVVAVSLVNVSIPKNIIPFTSYIEDFLSGLRTDQPVSAIPQDPSCIPGRLRGLLNTPLAVFRTYEGQFEMPDQASPPPVNLWNPPVGPWPAQPMPYPGQTVPTYVSNYVTVGGDACRLVCSGLGVYDLKDFTDLTRAATDALRRALLRRITRDQTSAGHDSGEIIDCAAVTSNDTWPYGYGDFQRFLPGPGLQLNYQPGLSDSANPCVPSGDYPVAFPDFRGNVWGHYDGPGARFQSAGLRTVVQDLFLNGDLDNLHGAQVISSDAQGNLHMTAELTRVTLGNFAASTNPNILNAQRIVFNGFGALSVTSNGLGSPPSVAQYQSAGGAGPGGFGAWTASGVYGLVSGTDPLATGPGAAGLLVSAEAPDVPQKRAAYYDVGAGRGALVDNVRRFRDHLVAAVPERDLVVHCLQLPRSLSAMQTTSPVACGSILSVPVRIRDAHVENYRSLFSAGNPGDRGEYWRQQFAVPLGSLEVLTLRFSDDAGSPVDIEQVLGSDRAYAGFSTRTRLVDDIRFTFEFQHIVTEIDGPSRVLDPAPVSGLDSGGSDPVPFEF